MKRADIKKNKRPYCQNAEETLLAPYAVKSSQTRGREYPEKEHELRTPFQRDRDRIIHSTAFRRLQYKTQVFVNHEGDHYRTRLTHTLETCQIARTIARALHLNEDLTETIALAHDLGHGPFGHAGEWALQALMKGLGGFEHNVQCLRIIETLEESYPDFPGLNLTYESREGLKKHPERFYADRRPRFRSLEAELVDLSDVIAYNTHDLDDGLRSGLIQEAQLGELTLWRDAIRYIRKKYPKLTAFKRKRLAIRLIVNKLVMDVISHTQVRIREMKIRTLSDLQKTGRPVATFSKGMQRPLMQLKRFLQKNLYSHPHVTRMTREGQSFLKAIFQVYLSDAKRRPEDFSALSRREGVHRSICDYIAGMTDRFALDEYNRLFHTSECV